MEPLKTGPAQPKPPTCIIVLGMAGSGKSTFISATINTLKAMGKNVYSINLDPAIQKLAFSANVDIRDSVNYKALMSKYTLGPNGAIMTALNLFATQFDQILKLLSQKPGLDYVVIDTPGQIEVFTWSASGQIIADSLACTYPTIITYVADTVRCQSVTTFMSNMLYSLSIMYKTKLPLLVTFNKIDVVSHAFAIDWIKDFEEFEKAVDKDESYRATLTRSLSLVLEEFYKHLKSCGVSALTGAGMKDYLAGIDACVKEYYEVYVELLKEKKQKAEEQKKKLAEDSVTKFMGDLKIKGNTIPEEKEENKE